MKPLVSFRCVRPRPSGPLKVVASSSTTTGTHINAADHWKQLNEPVHISATGNKSVRVKVESPSTPWFYKRTQNHGGEVSLARYMTLPVHQYYVLDPHLITSLDDDCFEFNVPKMEVGLRLVFLGLIKWLGVQ